ncbi:metal-dependent hydrolase [Alkalimarinus sediminis]|uniref:Metal-dependent hydrolase n=1 Tax=Alkalimarinus sediminis TaxID=1632866 RepID=A0A9E8HHD8_9ALTE|nr:metal-dependent hydrolase [Alkalimarinus sediminis]UZW74454.1 metal-dependent hydrolase [Alkalimarinus sediminis]
MNALISPLTRNLKFNLPKDKITHWHSEGIHVSQFFNTMSLFFPEGERFFIHSVRHYRDQITDKRLQKAVTAFIGQEAMHGREHAEYNTAMVEAGFPVDKMEQQVISRLNFFKQHAPAPLQLAITIALEHLTAIMADTLLETPEFLQDSDPQFVALWQWHALEETEHKAVAFDVYQTVMGSSLKSYTLRTTTLAWVTLVFFIHCYRFQFQILKQRNEHKNVQGWWTLLKNQWVSPGVLRKTIPAWLDYFRPGFHPWDHDNQHLLVMIDELVENVNTLNNQSQSAA